MDLLKRLNTAFLLSLCILTFGCKKRERLTTSTFAFRITPSAAAVQPNGTVTLSSQGPGAENTVWAVIPDTAGVISPPVGTSVTFTAGANIGQATVIATLDDAMARMQIGVVDYVGNPTSETTFDVYTDQGLPRPPLSSDIDVGGLTLTEVSTEFTPEGLKFLRATTSTNLDFWDVTVDDNLSGNSKDLSAFNFNTTPTAAIKFFIRLSRPMMGDRFTVEFKDTSNHIPFRPSNAGWTGFNDTVANDWQDVTLLIGSFGGTGGFDWAHVKVPFSIKLSAYNGANGPLTFDIDGVRWEK